ncbi:Uncharacterised protein [Mycobacteroides abscessus subsp. abscessus]|nr:Uncharacterised protein [Mycobacteroides abscessus subsp. abscessus]
MFGFGQCVLFVGGVGEQERAGARCSGGPELVHALRHRCPLVRQRNRMAVLIDSGQRLVDLDVLTVRQALDDAGLDAVLQHRAIAALQADGPAIGDVVHHRRQDDHADTTDPRRRVQRDVELQRDDVVHTHEREQHVERDRRRADGRPDRSVTRPLQQVVVGIITGELLLEEGVCDQQTEHQAHSDRNPHGLGDGVAKRVDLPSRDDAQQAVGPHHVEVRLATRGDL